MLIPIVTTLSCLLIVSLFVFAYLMDKLHGCIALAAFIVWAAVSTQPADAMTVQSDADWPNINDDMIGVLVGKNIVGDKIVLWANFCGGDADNSKRDHMHVYGIYNSHGAFIQGGCWQYDPAYTNKSRRIKYFDLNGAGWDSWPLDAFHVAHK